MRRDYVLYNVLLILQTKGFSGDLLIKIMSFLVQDEELKEF